MLKYLFVISELPFTSQSSEENLELALGFSAIGNKVSILFIGEACLQLLTNLDTTETGFSKKSLGIIPSLSTYGITDIYIMHEDLAKFKLASKQFNIETIVIDKADVQALYLDHDFIINNPR